MLNDRGTIVYDAMLQADGRDVMALLVWDAASQQTSIVVKADITGDGLHTLSDEYTDSTGTYKISNLVTNTPLGLFSDVQKDALSEDNYLAFTIAYDDDSKLALVEVSIPEPTTASVFGLMAAGLLLRRRRQNRQVD